MASRLTPMWPFVIKLLFLFRCSLGFRLFTSVTDLPTLNAPLVALKPPKHSHLFNPITYLNLVVYQLMREVVLGVLYTPKQQKLPLFLAKQGTLLVRLLFRLMKLQRLELMQFRLRVPLDHRHQVSVGLGLPFGHERWELAFYVHVWPNLTTDHVLVFQVFKSLHGVNQPALKFVPCYLTMCEMALRIYERPMLYLLKLAVLLTTVWPVLEINLL